jgi:hypothetical protein
MLPGEPKVSDPVPPSCPAQLVVSHLVTVCGAVVVFVHVTASPWVALTVLGTKQNADVQPAPVATICTD